MKKPRKPNHVWVVELWDFYYGWKPCSACGIDRKQGRRSYKDWKDSCPNDKFRISKYLSEAK